jgi:hypothetical protein
MPASGERNHRCALCNGTWPCSDRKHVVAALALLDAADREDDAGTPSAHGGYAVVPDPLPEATNTA